MTGTGKRPNPPQDLSVKRVRPNNSQPTRPRQTRVEPNGKTDPGVVLYVVGGHTNPDLHTVLRDFPLINRTPGKATAEHLAQVVHLVEEAIAAGGTHLLVPREEADWLGDHPLVAEYFAAHHELAEASAETGIVFRLRPPDTVTFTAKVSGWEIVPGDGIALIARENLVKPRVTLRPTEPARGLLSGRLAFSAEGLRTLHFGFRVTQFGRPVAQQARTRPEPGATRAAVPQPALRRSDVRPRRSGAAGI